MSRLSAYSKALPFVWDARKRQVRRKYDAALDALAAQPGRTVDGGAAEDGGVALIFSSMGGFAEHNIVDTMLAKALERRGMRVVVVLCDQQLRACHVADRYSYAFAIGVAGRDARQRRLCISCFPATERLRAESGLEYAVYSDGIAYAERAGSDALGPLDITDEIQSGIIRFAASSHGPTLDRLPQDIRARYEEGSATAEKAIAGLIRKYRPRTIIAHHGIYVPQGIVQKLAKAAGVDFYSWHFGYRKSTLIFSRGDTYHRELTQPLEQAFEQPLSADQRATIVSYLQSRMRGSGDWIHFNRNPTAAKIAKGDRPFVVAYTSVDWDAALHFPASIYSSQFHFLDDLVAAFRKREDVDLVIRIHPAEVTGFHPAAMSAEDYLRSKEIPDNVRIISATDPTSSYELAQKCIAAIVYNTKLGIELPPFGIPTIVAGDSWIRSKGFSYDVVAPADLSSLVARIETLEVTEAQRERALQFAYYFYYRRCIDTPELMSMSDKFEIAVSAAGVAQAQEQGTGFEFISERIASGSHIEVRP